MTETLRRLQWQQRPSGDQDSTTVVLNCRGIKFEIYPELLSKLPNSPLATIAYCVQQDSESKLDRNERVEIFLDRNPVCFEAILDYLIMGRLHYPSSVCGSLFRAELQYWGVDERNVQKCCINDFMRPIETEEKLRYFATFIEQSKHRPHQTDCGNPFSRWRTWMWNVMTLPTYSTGAKIYAVIIHTLLIINVMVIIAQSVYAVHVDQLDEKYENVSCKVFATFLGEPRLVKLFLTDCAFTLIFTAEVVVRCLCAPSIFAAVTSVVTYIEILSLIPFYLLLVARAVVTTSCEGISEQLLRTLFTLRVIRIFRLFALLRFYSIFRAFMYTLKSSLNEICVLFMLVGLTTIFMGTVTTLMEYAYIDDKSDNMFDNILTGFWWAIITATTVGYGDVVPESPLGRLMTVFVALSGIVVIALATPMVSANFDVISTFISGQSVMNSTRIQTEQEKMDDENVGYSGQNVYKDEENKEDGGTMLMPLGNNENDVQLSTTSSIDAL